MPLVAGLKRPRRWISEHVVLSRSGWPLEPVTVQLPDGRERVIPPERQGQAIFKDTFTPGHYRVTRPGAAPLTFAVQQDPAESDTTSVAVRPPTVDGDQVLAVAQHPRWRPIVLLAAALLLLETLLRLRPRRG